MITFLTKYSRLKFTFVCSQEVRAERDVLQGRMSEQALKISSLSARLQQQRNDAEALSHQATSQLSVQLHDALAEVTSIIIFYTYRSLHCGGSGKTRGYIITAQVDGSG